MCGFYLSGRIFALQWFFIDHYTWDSFLGHSVPVCCNSKNWITFWGCPWITAVVYAIFYLVYNFGGMVDWRLWTEVPQPHKFAFQEMIVRSMEIPLEQHMFLYYMYAEYSCSKNLCHKLIWKCSDDAPVLNKTTVYKYVISLQAVGSILDRKRTCRRCILTLEKLDEIGAPDGRACIFSKRGNITSAFASM